MAEKRPKSILGSLKNMLHRDAEKPSKPVAKKSSEPASRKSGDPARKKAAEKPPVPAQQQAAASSAESAPAPETAPEAKADKKKVQNQPWYRHRQRW